MPDSVAADAKDRAPAEESPLEVAAKSNDAATIGTLLAAKADPTAGSKPFGWTPLHIAAGYNAVDAIETLAEAGVDLNLRANDGETPLFIAAQEGHEKAVRCLVAARADIGARSEDDETALHSAVQHIGSKGLGHLTALLELRADPSIRDVEGHDCFSHALLHTNRSEEIQKVLKAASSSQSCTQVTGMNEQLQVACRRGQLDCVRQLLEWETNPAECAQKSLLTAATAGNIEVMRILLEFRADLHHSSNTAAAGAVEGEGAKGVAPQIATPLLVAADSGRVKMVRWLLDQRCDASEVSRDGATALMAASVGGVSEACTILLAARAQVNHQADGGWTPLLAASQVGKADTVRLLLDARADLELSTSDGANARKLAEANNHPEVVKLIDTRMRLNQRQRDAPTKAVVVEDSRDLDTLLAQLGEPTGGKKAKSKAKKKQKESSAAAVAEDARVVTSAEPEAPVPVAPEAVVAPAVVAAKKKTNEEVPSEKVSGCGATTSHGGGEEQGRPKAAASGKKSRNRGAKETTADSHGASKNQKGLENSREERQASVEPENSEEQALRVRLKEIAQRRLELDAEELSILKRIDKLRQET
eukprot:TRINITY_DN45255_c0_g1_i1.p1 TRINITY_DN45255_c0_g1~~TRINITY_DN45255_c0_g1_i1.p1  ORF type:complete len:591 (-),score=159.21 TRINITY_DN45255_c0_g1_i1:80-1852(-)